ncbi:MAG TPA: hypothetical protein EYH38_12035, partial [Leucothrix sp.]|nr:hypothetical protein [Leucothrix sp.]
MSIQWELNPQHSGSLIRLQTLLGKLKGFNALVAEHNHSAYRDGLIHFIQQSQAHSLILDIKELGGFSEFEQAYNTLEDSISSVHLINLESLEAKEQQAFFRGINYHREHLARSLQGNLIFWLNKRLIKKMALEAADFWAWREQVLNFSVREENTKRNQEGWNKIVNLDSPEKRQRISEINDFLQKASEDKNITRADLHQELGRLYWSVGDYAKAENVLQIAINTYAVLDEAQSKAVSQRDLAEIWNTQGEKDKALTLLKNKVLPIFKQLKNEGSKAVTMGKIADILQSRGELDEALRIRQ